jgi:TRAP-type C4-dicarboxylate transport system permease small subunit
MNMLDAALTRLDQLTRHAGVALVGAIVLILTAQIFFRYGFNSSLTWSEEVSTWCMVWTVYLGSGSLMRKWEHVHIPMLLRALPLRPRAVMIIVAKLVTLATVAFIAWQGALMVSSGFHIRSESLGLSTMWIKYAVPVGALLMTIFALGCVAEDLRLLLRGEMKSFERYGDVTGDARDAAPGS